MINAPNVATPLTYRARALRDTGIQKRARERTGSRPRQLWPGAAGLLRLLAAYSATLGDAPGDYSESSNASASNSLSSESALVYPMLFSTSVAIGFPVQGSSSLFVRPFDPAWSACQCLIARKRTQIISVCIRSLGYSNTVR